MFHLLRKYVLYPGLEKKESKDMGHQCCQAAVFVLLETTFALANTPCSLISSAAHINHEVSEYECEPKVFSKVVFIILDTKRYGCTALSLTILSLR